MNDNKKQIKKDCPLAETSRIIGDYWNLLILRQLITGPQRFNEFIDQIEGSTSATISQKLKQLNTLGIIDRRQFECIPPKVEYTLTKKGQKFAKVISAVEELSKDSSL